MSTTNSIDAGVAHRIGHYADAVRVPAGYDQIYVSGTPGLTPDGTVPGTITDEARQAWRNVADILSRAGASLTDIVSVRQWLTNAEDVDAYVAVRGEFIHHEPVAMLAVVTGLVWPNIAVEIEVIAARPATG
jgi:2-iminobutanoate/2-iminopropanoate deaminase